MRTYLRAVGLLGPGLPGWAASAAILSGKTPYTPSAVVVPPPEALPPAERRRTGPPIKLALAIGLEALAQAGHSAADVATVFTSSGGDGQIIHDICQSLAGAERDISPTRFHNSVHNAAAGYWGIALPSHAASTSLCGHDWSFIAGLLEACAQSVTAQGQALMISYDLPYPEPLNRVRPIVGTMGVALLVQPDPVAAFAQLELRIEAAPQPATTMTVSELEALRGGNPTARALPLLSALAEGSDKRIFLEYFAGQTVSVRVSPRA